MTATLVIRSTSGEELPPLLSTQDAARILGWHEQTVLAGCADGSIETMPRRGTGPWQIITAKLLRQLGLLEVVA